MVLNKKKGFTLIELLVSLVLLGLVFVGGLLNMVLLGSGYLINIKHAKNANYLLTNYVEYLLNLPYDSPLLTDDGDTMDLEERNPVLADFRDSTTVENFPFTIVWNIAENQNDERKTIRIHVLWIERGEQRFLSRTFEIWRK